MIRFKISIAEITVEVNAFYQATKIFCQKYLTDSSPNFAVEITVNDIKNERERSYLTDLQQGRKPNNYSDEHLETMAVYRKIAEKLPFFNAFVFHASAVAVDDKAYVFTAKSGTGKSTHAGFYSDNFGSRAKIINDDKPIILLKGKSAYVCGTPWSGKHDLNTNIILPLKAICILNRGEENIITKIKPQSAIDKLISQSYRPVSPEAMQRFLDLLSSLTENTEFYNLFCNLNPEAALVSFNGMQN